MTTKPSVYLDWLVGNPDPNTDEPPALLKETGWLPGESPYSEHFNFMFANLDTWVKVLEERDQHDWIVGSGSNADFATLALALASSSVFGGDTILVTNNTVLAAALVIDKGVDIEFTRAGGITGVAVTAGIKISITAANVRIKGGTFNSFNTVVFDFGASATNCIIHNVSTNQQNVFSDYSVTAPYKPSITGVRINEN